MVSFRVFMQVYIFKGLSRSDSGDFRLQRGSIVELTSGLDGFPENSTMDYCSIADLEGASNGKRHIAGYIVGFGDVSEGEDGLRRRVVALCAKKVTCGLRSKLLYVSSTLTT